MLRSTGFFSEMSDFSEDCVEKSRTCLGSYYPACARAENENHLCHGSGIFTEGRVRHIVP